MADSSWDNGGYGKPTKVGMPTWAKVTIGGCGLLLLISLGTCAGGYLFLGSLLKGIESQAPKRDSGNLRRNVLGFAIDRIRPEWEDFRAVVEQLRTEQGCKALYAANPDLAATWPREADFLAAAKAWQPGLPPAPELTPELLQGHEGIQIKSQFGGKVRVDWRPKAGPSVSVTFDRSRKPGDTASRRVLEVEVQPASN